MKKIIIKKMIPLLIVLIVPTIMFGLGFKITYNPKLENNWEAISACAGWGAVLASAISILIATAVPGKIANSQNKIALFEKRYSVYIQLQKCISFEKDLRVNIGNIGPKTVNLLFSNVFIGNAKDSEINPQYKINILLNDVCNKIRQAEFLFDKKSSDEIVLLSNALLKLLAPTNSEYDVEESIAAYVNQATIINDQILPKIQEQLKLY